MENENQTPHKRRVHYKGKYPKKFEEKYKELQPEKYKDTIAHVIQKGNTPAGMHISIMVKEILDFLQIKPGQTGFDATLGYGGHTKAMLEQLQGQGHIHATDVDPAESAKTKKRLADQGFGADMLTIHLQNFCTIDEIAKEVGGFDFVLADLGVSSMQIDNPERGFSFKVDGPLDLRLNQEAGISAAERLDTISRDELAGMLYENSDEPYCEELAKAITDEIRKGHRVDTTTKLRRIIEDTLDFLPEKDKKETIKKTCQRTFQALRIDVNREFEVLYEFMEKLPGALKPGGRVAILTFHSGEDKLVKRALKEGYRAGIYSEYAKDVVRPSAQECAQNGRARSTKMRWAIREGENSHRNFFCTFTVGVHPLFQVSSIYGGFFPFGICQEIYDTVVILISGIRECGKSVNAVCPFFFIPVGHKTYLGVGGIIGLIGPYLIRPESGGVGCTSGGIRTTVRTSVGNILFHNSIVEKMQKLCYNASACFTKNTRLFT